MQEKCLLCEDIRNFETEPGQPGDSESVCTECGKPFYLVDGSCENSCPTTYTDIGGRICLFNEAEEIGFDSTSLWAGICGFFLCCGMVGFYFHRRQSKREEALFY